MYLFSGVALLWSNKDNKATAFPIFVFTSILTLLLSVAVTAYYFTQNELVFSYFFEPNNNAALASFLIFLYFSRYFFIGWIVKLALAMVAHKRKEEIDNEKESIEIQTAVDKAFQNVFDQEPEPEEPHVRPDAIPESMGRIPRVTAVAPGATPPPRKQPDESTQNNRTANGHVNRAYERDSEERPPRQDAREPRYPREEEQRARSAAPRADGREPQRVQQQQPRTRDDQRREDGWRESRVPDTDKEFLHAYDRRGDRVSRDGRPPQEYPMKEYSRREYPSESVPGRPRTPALDDGEEYRNRESRYQEHGAGLRRDYKPHGSSEDIYKGRSEPGDSYDARSKSPHRGQYGGDRRQQEYYPEEEALRKGAYGELRGRRQGDVEEPRRGGGVGPAQLPDRRSSPEYAYDEVRYRADRAVPPERGRRDNYDARGGHPQQQQLQANDSRRPRRDLEDDYDRRADTARDVRPQHRTTAESARSSYEDYEPNRADSRRPVADYGRERSSSPTQPLDASRYLRADEDARSGKKRPSSAHYSREFDYGPGPQGYNVPSPHSRPRSMILVGDEDEVARPPGGGGLKREESFVQKIKPRYESSTGGALRTGPAPVGGVPAVGPASLRSRGVPKGRY
ncbi:hypothetical protein V5799_026488 [Amblyomma americanum]|uniref:Uncharacterized protein n=1 Tax=Amblyomma americanum TaxID=6943 RepID=A0AAQ4DIF0_AMBAM